MLRTLLLAALLAAASAVAQGDPQGKVLGNTLHSSGFPSGSITIDKNFTYVGTTSFVLYKVATCEIHVFAEIDKQQVKRFYWVQFEGFLPDIQKTYNYGDDPQNTTLGGQAFHQHHWFFDLEVLAKNLRPGSDTEAVLKLFADKGLKVGPNVMQIRLVRLDEAKRKELMIIYSEALPANFRAKDMRVNDKYTAQAEELYQGLRQRAIAGLKVDMR